ncbi:MAG: DUF2911 domain-containing protein [Acidobacteriota bacterium]
MRRSFIVCLAFSALVAVSALAQGISLPPNGDNQKASVTQYIGPVAVIIDYHSPDVHAPNGDDRRGKIWGTLVPWGTIDDPFGTCTECPWRGGANENTTLTVSHDVKVQGQPLKAGRYGLHLIPAEQGDWTLVLSNNSTSWGSFFYDVAEDALRVKVTPAKSEYHEWLTYEFTDRQPSQATAALKWEDLQIPWTIQVDDVTGLYLTKIRQELRDSPGFNSQNWVAAAQYALQAKRPGDALELADAAVNRTFIGEANFQTLNTLAMAQEAAGKTADATATRERAMNHPTATAVDLHQYGRQLLAQGKKADALRIWELNAKRNPNVWPVHVGLARGYSANGRYKEALKEAKLALAQAPDDVNKKSLAEGIAKLEAGKDMNQ